MAVLSNSTPEMLASRNIHIENVKGFMRMMIDKDCSCRLQNLAPTDSTTSDATLGPSAWLYAMLSVPQTTPSCKREVIEIACGMPPLCGDIDHLPRSLNTSL